MGRNRFQAPDVVRIELSDGDWIEVYKDLNNGQQKKLESCGQKPPVNVDGKVVFPIDWEIYELERALIFITDWSLIDGRNNKVVIGMSALKAMTPSDFEEINQAIFKHVMDRASEKKAEREAKTKPEAPSPNLNSGQLKSLDEITTNTSSVVTSS